MLAPNLVTPKIKSSIFSRTSIESVRCAGFNSENEKVEIHGSFRYPDSMNRIIIDPNICNGLPTIKGTRITAQTVLEFLSAGDAIEDVLDEYPTLTRDDVLACLAYSVQLMKHHFTLQGVA
jgi:uncharacterized protein (DUF433 family)